MTCRGVLECALGGVAASDRPINISGPGEATRCWLRPREGTGLATRVCAARVAGDSEAGAGMLEGG